MLVNKIIYITNVSIDYNNYLSNFSVAPYTLFDSMKTNYLVRNTSTTKNEFLKIDDK